MAAFKIRSLFDGSGGFPLAAVMCGIRPVWASEVEPYPIAVTKSWFPEMVHLGDVSKVCGGEIEPVDVITFGSPCQDMSVAGKRAGLKHEGIGDEETTRSGLFMEAVRIAKEMREATNGEYPKFLLWENVPGAFSSNRGEDFRIVLEKLIKIVEPYAVMPAVPSGGWAYADRYCGDGWSLAYRVFDAQHWGVPQRRRRIHLVLDLTGGRAGEVLFEREGVRGYFTQGRTPWQGAAADAERGSGADDRTGECVAYGFPLGFRPENVRCYEETATTLCNGTRAGFTTGVVCYDARGNGDSKTAPTITEDHNNGVTDYPTSAVEPVYCIPIHDQATRFTGKHGNKADGKGNGLGVGQPGDPANTLTGGDRHAVGYAKTYQKVTGPLMANSHPGSYTGQDAYTDMLVVGKTPPPIRYIVRRLTPTECARLQGFPDEWGHPDRKDKLTNDEYAFWMGVRNVHAEINGKAQKQYTREQMLKWYNGLHTDSAEYKMWGNGIALPPALYCMQGIADALGVTG